MKTTLIVIAVAAGVLSGYDGWTAYAHGTNSTISWTLYTLARSYPAVPFAFGFLMGHLFASQKGTT